MPRRSVALACVAVALVLCADASGATRGWTRADVHAVTQPIAVGGRLLVYAAAAGKLRVLALDARTGATAWSAAASVSATPPGEAPSLGSTDGRVLYLRAVARQVAQVVAADARTGRVAWRSKAGVFTSWPRLCPGPPVTVCLTGVVAGRATRGTELRFDAGTGTPLPSLVFSSTPVGRSVGVGLFDPGLRKPEYLVAAEGAHVSWSEPLAKIFTLPGASTDWGWYFERVERDGIFVGSPGWAPIARSGATGFDDLARTMTAGFRIRDGRVVWRNRGTTYICNYLPCAESVGVRLRSYGTMFISLTGGSLPVASPKSTVSVEGFDLATGRTRWSFDAGHDPGLSSQTLLPPVAGKSAILVHDRAGRLIRLDLRDGSHRRAASSSVGWCRSPLSYREEVAYPAGGFATTTYYGQNAIYACDGRRRHVARPATVPGYLGSLGARVGALVAWTSTTGAVVAAPA